MSEAAYALPQPVVFIDASLPDLATLRAGLPVDATVHLLDPAQHGLKQMAAVLAGQFDIAALHLIVHGAPGQLLLGHAAIDLAELKACREDITTIAAAMAEDGELLIYGCEVAAGREGRQFIHTLTSMTGLKVAAATHPVGATALGGHWTLDEMPLSMTAQPLAVPAWRGVLPALGASEVANINPGATGSSVWGLTVFNNVLYFIADDGTHGNELWKYDGTNLPSLVADIYEGSGYGLFSAPTVFNNALYFAADGNDGTGTELWKYDANECKQGGRHQYQCWQCFFSK
jgi:ELWxxDGT repeat protein